MCLFRWPSLPRNHVFKRCVDQVSNESLSFSMTSFYSFSVSCVVVTQTCKLLCETLAQLCFFRGIVVRRYGLWYVEKWKVLFLPLFLFSSKRKEKGKAEAVVCVYEHLVKPCPAYSPAPSFSVVLLPLIVLLWVCQLVCSQLNCFWIFINERWKGK